ncbi:hypothetical protein SERLA73DRAFT_63973, partial [Serpula lacrymans var. lacrymans S7.3]
VGQRKKHNKGFEGSSVARERGLPSICFFDSYIIVPPFEIHLCQDLGTSQFVY